VLDATGTDLGTRVAAVLRGGPQDDTLRAIVRAVSASEMPAAESAATREVVRHERAGYLVLDATTLMGANARYAGRNTSRPNIEFLTDAVHKSLLAQRLERAGLAPQLAKDLSAIRTSVDGEEISDRGHGGPGQISEIAAYGLGFTLYAMIVIYGNVILRSIAEEKNSRVAEVVVASVPPQTLMAGKVLGISGVALTQLCVWVAVSTVVYRVRGPILHWFGADSPAFPFPSLGLGTAIVLAVLFVLGFVAYAALYAAMGAMVGSQDDAQQASLPITMIVVCAVVLIPPVLLEPNGAVARTFSRFPFTAPILMPVRMTVVVLPWYEIAGTLVGVAAACAAAIWFAARIYRVGLLMYGKRPSPRELLRWIRRA
jgi:ABC-2 type transport system permease protein